MPDLPALGHTRSSRQPTHLLHTPDAFVRTPLPGVQGGLAIVHASPALGAAFLWSTIELEAGGTLAPAAAQRFLYVLAGELSLTLDAENYTEGAPQTHSLTPGAFAWLPPGEQANITAATAVCLAVIEKSYEPLHGVARPAALVAHAAHAAAEHLNGDPALEVRTLMPATPAFDFAVNTMTYAPGASLPQVEVHVMEHGCLMLEGAGIYRLGEHWYPVQAGDFIWMAPFCPQWFAALGKQPAKYLIYKDFNRTPIL